MNEGKRILVTDADPVTLAISSHVLRQRGYEVIACKRGIDALVSLKERRNRFGLLISSTHLAGMTGQQLAMKVRAMAPGLPVVLFVADGEPLDEEEARSLGIRTQLRRPISAVGLTQAVGDVFGHRDPLSHALLASGR